MSAITIDYNGNQIQELNLDEIDFVFGGWTWRGLAGAGVAGGIVGGLAGFVAGGGGALPGAVGGALLGMMGYLIVDMIGT